MKTTPLGARWLGSPNFTAGRDGHRMDVQPAWVVLHTMVGTVESANARFQQPGQQASATYGVGLDGRIVQWVSEDDAPWANGNTGTGGVGDNLDSIAIEHEDGGDFNGPRTPELYAASAALVRDICQRYGIPIDRQHVIGHRECTGNAPTACPDSLDMDRIVRVAVTGAPEGDDMDPTLAAKLDEMLNVLGSGGDNREPNPWIVATLNAILAGVQSVSGIKSELDAIKAEIEAGGSVDAASILARIEKALQTA